MGNNHSDASAGEARGAVRWLLGAGGMAILLSIFLFWADDTVMGGARERDIEHNRELTRLREAQASLAGSANDPRQLLPLTIEGKPQHQEEHKHSAADTTHDSGVHSTGAHSTGAHSTGAHSTAQQAPEDSH